jgi:hypothetical protein
MARYYYDPYDWYWKADDGRIYSSKQDAIVDETNPGYQYYYGDGSFVTRWPRDASGNQTSAALQDVLTPYGLTVNPG